MKPLDLLTLLAGHFERYRRRELQDIVARVYGAPAPTAAAVRSVVDATVGIRRFAYLHGYVRYRHVASRLRHRAAARSNARNGKGWRVLSLLCPTRERPRSARTLLESVTRTAAHPERIELLFYVDADDPEREAYDALCCRRPGKRQVRCRIVVGEPMSVSKSWNILAERAVGDLLLMANDDQVYVDYGWDLRLDDECDKFPDDVVCMYFDGGQYRKPAMDELSGGDFPIVTRKWYEVLGYFTPGVFEFWSNDNWILDIARRVGRLHPIPNVFVDHLHYDSYRSRYDRTYQRHRSSRDKSIRDFALYLNTAAEREAAAAKLRSALRAAGDAAVHALR